MSSRIYNRSEQGLSMETSPCMASLKFFRRRCDLCTQSLKQAENKIRVEEGSTIFVEKLDVQEGEAVVFDKVVAYCNRSLRVGTPYVKGVKVNAKVEKQGKAKKIIVYKYKAKKGSSHRKQGHRQPYTKLTIESIEA